MPLRKLGCQRPSLRILPTSAREITSLKLEISLLDTQVYGNQSRLLRAVLLRNRTSKGMSLILNKLLWQTIMLCQVCSILKGLWSLLPNSLKQIWFQFLHKMIQYFGVVQVRNLHANMVKASYIYRHLTNLYAPCKLTPGCKPSIRWVKVRGHLFLNLVIHELGPIITLSLL